MFNWYTPYHFYTISFLLHSIQHQPTTLHLVTNTKKKRKKNNHCRLQPHHLSSPIAIVISKVNPWVFELVQKKRQSISPDPLQGYDGIKFGSPFWYEGAGDIWRRVSHGSKLVTVKDCERVRNIAEECLRNPANANDYCYRLYGHSIVCEAGVHCPYLRFDFIRCLQEHHLTDFAAVRNCVENVPQYKPCTKGYVKQAKKSV